MSLAMRVRVRVRSGARKESFQKAGEDIFEVSVKEPAERNAANTRVRALVAMHYKVLPKAVRIIAGQRGKNKTLTVVV